MKIETIMHKVLVDINNILEEDGVPINNMIFAYVEDDEEWQGLMQSYECSSEELRKAFNAAFTRKLLSGSLRQLRLTEDGQALAISVKLGRDRSYDITEKSVVNNFTFAGDIHGGSNIFGSENTQIIQNFINELAKQIDMSDAPDEEKKTAKELLYKALSHPLVNTTIGIGSNVLLKLLG